MLRTNLDGVRVLATEGPAPLRAGLVFGVGRRDESFVKGGLTHLVEHLVMRRVGRTTAEVNASVDLSTTEFTASGSPATVAAFLRQVCTALVDLPVEFLSVEADVLRAEEGQLVPPAVAHLLGEVYGAAGVGLAGYRDPALQALTAQDVRQWSARFFVRENAALWLSGPIPQDIRLPLPSGERPVRAPQPLRPLSTPARTTLPVEQHVVLGAHLPALPALDVTLAIARERVEDGLRTRRGLSYHVDADRLGIDDDQRFAYLVADVREGHEGVAAQVLWRCLQRLVDDGPTGEELGRHREQVEEYLADPAAAADEARAAARAAVTGITALPGRELLAQVAASRPRDVQEAAAALRDRALLGAPDWSDVDLPGIPVLEESFAEPVDGRVFRRRLLSDAPRGARLVVGDDGASLLGGPLPAVTVRWRDAIGLIEVEPQEWQLLGVDGFAIPISPKDWRAGHEAARLVQDALPPSLQVTADRDDIQTHGVVLVTARPHQTREGLWFSKSEARIVPGTRWTAVVQEGDLFANAARLSNQLGRKTDVLVLHQRYADLGYVLLRDGEERDRHVWGYQHGDPRLLAEATGVEESEIADLLGTEAPVDETLDRLVHLLDLPPEVPGLLRGQEPPATAEHVPVRGSWDGFVAASRGEFDAPDGWLARYLAWEKRRAPSYRAYSAASAVAYGALAWWLGFGTDDLTAWRTVFAAVAAGLALTSTWYLVTPGRGD